jgi:putative redox protein
LPEKKNGKLVKLTANLTKRKTGEAGKLSTHVTAKIKIEGDLTAEQRELLKQADACYVHRMIEGEWNIENSRTY